MDISPFMTEPEWSFLVSNLKPSDVVLEWGAGGSTIAMSKIVSKVVSIEHTDHWTREVRKMGRNNIKVHHVTTNRPLLGTEDGTREQFKDYVELPLKTKEGPYSVILIDGRARAACSETAAKLAGENTKVFMHDYKKVLAPDRKSYAECLKWFVIEKRVGSLVLLKRNV